MLRFIFALFILSSFSGVSAQDFPISFSRNSWEIGDITQRKMANHILQITNNTPNPVGIYQLTPASPHLSARAKKTALQPGETTDIHFQLFTQLPTGAFESYITVTLIGDKRSLKFPVKANILEAPPMQSKLLKVDTAGLPVLKIGR